ncbi:MAG: hypothetical protein HYX68_12990 [Planctomycetes bacterium]|nr:hypothetical protein [Planctomycetota bacterium]
MAVKNMQTVASTVAENQGVEASGTDCAGSMRTDGRLPAPFLSLFSLPQPGTYPMLAAPDADLRAVENPAAAQAAERTGRSRCDTGANPSARLVRDECATMLSTWSAFGTKRTHG